MGIIDGIKQKLTKTHLIELGIIAVFFMAAILGEFLPSHKMDIPGGRNNPMNSYKNTSNTMPSILNDIISLTVPMVFIFFFSRNKRDSMNYLVTVSITFLFDYSCSAFLTEVFKLFAGRPRPNYWALVDEGHEIDAYKSFPSGHSSVVFSGMMFLSLLISGELKVFAGNGSLLRLCIALLPLVYACIIGITRTRDYWHNFDDVLGGTLLGCVVALVTYLTKFKSLWGNYAGEVDEEDDLGNEADEFGV